MKKYIFTLFALWALLTQAQSYSSSFSLQIGYAEEGYSNTADYNFYLNKNESLSATVYISFADYEKAGKKIPYVMYSLQFGYAYKVWNGLRKKMNARVIGGIQLGYESINNGEKELDKGVLITDRSKFILGPYVGMEAEYSMDPNFSWVLRINESYHINSDVGKFTPYFGAGIRYFIF